MVVKNGGRMGCLISCCWVLPRQCWKQLALWELQVSDDTIRPFPPFMCIIIALSRENPKGYYGWTIWTPFAGWTLRRLLYKEWLDIQRGWHSSQSTPSAEIFKQAMCKIAIPIQRDGGSLTSSGPGWWFSLVPTNGFQHSIIFKVYILLSPRES